MRYFIFFALLQSSLAIAEPSIDEVKEAPDTIDCQDSVACLKEQVAQLKMLTATLRMGTEMLVEAIDQVAGGGKGGSCSLDDKKDVAL